MPKREPLWIDRAMVEAIHDLQLDEHGGLRGLRDAGALESALGRPRHKWSYDPKVDLAACAAAYAFGIAKNHPFSDGNKRSAFQAKYVFLALNGVELSVDEPNAVLTMIDLAAGKVNEDGLAAWIRENTGKRKGKRRRARD